jgi:hypothetical protein
MLRGGTFTTCYIHLGGGYILASVAYKFKILLLYWVLVAKYA